MKTIKTNGYNVIRVKETWACGDLPIDTEVVDGITYDIWVGFNGYTYYYATVKEN